MSANNQLMPEVVYQYYRTVAYRESPLLRALREETAQLSNAEMQIPPEQGQLLQFLVQLISAKTVLEIGTFTGYSALCMAMALPEEGQLFACDMNATWTDIAQRYWKKAGVMAKIQLHVAPALTTLATFHAEEKVGTFDLAFIDADKVNYDHYYEQCLQLVRVGGMILIDNVLTAGQWRMYDANDMSPCVKTIRALNQKIQQDHRVNMVMLPMGGGLSLLRRVC